MAARAGTGRQMKTRGVIGKRIVRVEQGRTARGQGYSPANDVRALVLEDGTRLVPMTIESETGEYMHEISVQRPGQAPVDFGQSGAIIVPCRPRRPRP